MTAVYMFGYSSRSELFKLNAIHLLSEEERSFAVKKHQETLEQGLSGNVEYRMQRKGGEIFPAEVSGSIIMDSAGEPTAVLGMIKDVSEKHQLHRDIAQALDDERKRIGYNLHDDLGQTLTGISLHVQSMKQEMLEKCDDCSDDLEAVEQLVKAAVMKTRSLSKMLSPVDVTKGGFYSALEDMIYEINSIFLISCNLVSSSVIRINNNQAATHIYYIIRESINNALKHGKADEINVFINSIDSELNVIVADNGKGLSSKKKTNGIGLQVMKYRAQLIRAHIEFEDMQDDGFKVKLRIKERLLK